MSNESNAPKSYSCPKCGKEHKADLTAMEGHPEIHGKVHCMGCHVLLWISLGEDGKTKCEIFEEHLHDIKDASPAAGSGAPATAAGVESAAPSEPKAATTSAVGGGLPILPIIVAAIVAAVVSLALGSGKGEAPKESKDDQALTAIESRLSALETQIGLAQSEAATTKQTLTQMGGELLIAAQSNTDARNAQRKALAEIKKSIADLTEALAKLEKSYVGLNGRIEGNYTTLKSVDKRLKALEGK